MAKLLLLLISITTFVVQGIISKDIGVIIDGTDSNESDKSIEKDDLENTMDPILNDTLILRASKCNVNHGCYKGQSIYIENTNKRTHDEASKYCVAMNGKLISVENCEKNSFITNLLKKDSNCAKNHYWTSGYQTGNNVWYWGNGERVTYTNWKLGEPNGKKKNEFCIQYRSKYLQWNDEKCSSKCYYICELNAKC